MLDSGRLLDRSHCGLCIQKVSMYIRQDLIFTQNYDDVVISHSDSNSELPRGAARLGSSGNEGVSGMGERTARGVIIASMIIESRRELPRMQSEEGQGCAQVKRAISFEMVRGESASKYSEIPWAQQNNVQLGGGCVAPSGMVYSGSRWGCESTFSVSRSGPLAGNPGRGHRVKMVVWLAGTGA